MFNLKCPLVTLSFNFARLLNRHSILKYSNRKNPADGMTECAGTKEKQQQAGRKRTMAREKVYLQPGDVNPQAGDKLFLGASLRTAALISGLRTPEMHFCSNAPFVDIGVSISNLCMDRQRYLP